MPLLVLLLITAATLAVSVRAEGTEAERWRMAARQSVTIMPMGDSITGSTGCWRAQLWAKLRADGHTDVDFTGNGVGPECDSIFDDDAVAYSGTRLVNKKRSVKFLRALKANADSADIALIHLGSNDIRDDASIPEILNGLTTVIGLLRQGNPDMTILVAQVIPVTTQPMDEDCPQCPDKVREYNAAIPDWAASLDREESPIRVVDQYEGFDDAADLYDGLHPDGSGNRKLADTWFTAIDGVLDDRRSSRT